MLIALGWTHNKNKLYNTLDCLSRDMLHSDILEKGFGVASFSTAFCVWFFRKKCFSRCILLYDQISLSHCLYLLRCSRITCYPVCDVVNFVINVSFLIEPLSYMIKKSEKKIKYFKSEKSI